MWGTFSCCPLTYSSVPSSFQTWKAHFGDLLPPKLQFPTNTPSSSYSSHTKAEVSDYPMEITGEVGVGKNLETAGSRGSAFTEG